MEADNNWITLDQASDISGASVAILQDTLRKYSKNSDKLKILEKEGQTFLDKNQIINLFPSSASAIEKEKIPGALFRWFDDLRRAYETSLNTMFKRVEAVKDEHRIDLAENYDARISELESAYQNRLNELKHAKHEQIELLKSHLNRYEKDTTFYQQQILTQQETLAQLNKRYDAVILSLNTSSSTEKNITPSHTHTQMSASASSQQHHLNKPTQLHPAEKENAVAQIDTHNHNESSVADLNDEQNHNLPEVEMVSLSEQSQIQISEKLKQAYAARDLKQFEQAVTLFETAALLGSNKAMGALGRSYFVGEGVKTNIEKGIAFLYLAATYQFKPAQVKIEQVAARYPAEYQHGIELAKSYAIQIKLNQQVD